MFEEALAEIDSPDWVHLVRKPRADLPLLQASRKFAGGLLRAAIAYDRPAERIKQVWFTGDFFVNPSRTVADLEAALKDAATAEVPQRIAVFFAERSVDMLALAPDDFAAVIAAAVAAEGNDMQGGET